MENNRYITVTYDLHATRDGEEKLMEQATEEQPMTFVSGLGLALEPFENKLATLATGSDFDFTLQPDEAFGAYDPGRVLTLPKTLFYINGHFDGEHIYPDAYVPLQDAEGNRFYGHVVEMDNDNVLMDLNHPLAGRVLRFVGHVIENREATADEVQQSKQPHHCHHGGHCGKHCHDDGKEECNCEGNVGCGGDCDCQREEDKA